MITGTPRYSPNTREISFDLIDGEVILIHLKTGSYFNLENTGAWVWSLIEKGVEVGHILQLLSEKYPEASELDVSLNAFFEHLLSEDLIVDASDSINGHVSAAQDTFSSSELGPVFAPPTLNVYTDMQTLLLLDPIHEVDEAGWPASQPVDLNAGSTESEATSKQEG